MTKDKCKMKKGVGDCSAYIGVKCDCVNDSICLAARQAFEIGQKEALKEESRKHGHCIIERTAVKGCQHEG